MRAAPEIERPKEMAPARAAIALAPAVIASAQEVTGPRKWIAVPTITSTATWRAAAKAPNGLAISVPTKTAVLPDRRITGAIAEAVRVAVVVDFRAAVAVDSAVEVEDDKRLTQITRGEVAQQLGTTHNSVSFD